MLHRDQKFAIPGSALEGRDSLEFASGHGLLAHERPRQPNAHALLGIVTGVVAVIFGLGALVPFPNLIPANIEHSRWMDFFWVCLFLALCGSWLANGLWNACSRRMATSLSGQMIVFETLFACVYGFLFNQRMPGLMEIIAIALLLGSVGWAARRHRVPTVKLEQPVV